MKGNRIEGLDIIRSFAIFCVVLVHSMQASCPVNSIEDFNNLSSLSKVVFFSLYTIGRIGVPLFLILSGYLLLPRNFDEVQTKRFYKKNLLSLFVTWELWLPANNWLALWYFGIPFQLTTVFKDMLMIEIDKIGHSWYMPVIFGIYLFIPFVSRLFKNMSNREFLMPMVIVYIYLFVVPSLSYLKSANWNSLLDLNFSGGLYGFYVILGYLLHRFENEIKGSIKLAAFIPIFIILTTCAQIWIHSSSGHIFRLWYDFFLMPPIAVVIFILLRKIKLKTFSGLIENISKCSFGMYFIHVFFIAIFLKYGLLDFIVVNELRMLLLTICVYSLSFIATKWIKNIPHLGKILVR